MVKMKRWFSMIMAVVFAAGLLFNPLTASVEAAGPKAVIFPYIQPAKYAASVNYTLKANGVDIPVVKAFDDYDYANFSMSNGPVTFEVTILNTDKVHDYAISPMKLGIQPDSVVGRTLTFTTQKDEYLIVTMNSRKTRLVIAADPAETDVPAATGTGIFNVGQAPYLVASTGGQTGVAARTAAIQQAIDDASSYGTQAGNGVQGIVYIPAGQYYIGNLVLKSNTALYMQPGAAFIGTGKTADYKEHWFKDSMGRPATWWISTAFDSTNIKLYGRGTIDGNGAALYADKSTNAKGMINNLVVPIATSNFIMDGITIRESASWAVTPVRSHDLSFTNVKFFNSLGMGENDGIDVCESQNVVVRNAIGIALDDPFSTKAWKETTDIASGKVPWPGSPQPVSNVLFEDAISWTLCYGFKIGQGVMQDQNDIVFRDSVVYKAAVGFAIHHKYGAGAVSNVTFENMDVEDISGFNEDNSAWMTLFTVNGSNSGVGPVTGIKVKNITVRDAGEGVAKIKGMPDAPISGITFENVYMPGKAQPATNLYEMNFANKDNYSDITIKPVQNPEPRPQTNLALNHPAVASSNDSTVDTAPWAFDGDMSTRFGSKRAVDPGWIYVDLGTIKSINEVRLYWEAAYAKSYQIQVSNDLQTWNNVYSTTTGKGLMEKIAFNQTDARYVRMYGTVRATQYGYSMWEFEVYGPEVFPETIALNKTAVALLPGETALLTAAVLPANTTNNKAIWSSSNKNIAAVDSNGLVTATGLGTASITAKTANGEFKAAATVTVAELSKPQLLSAIAGDGYVNLNWSNVDKALNYHIYASTTAGSYGAPVATVGNEVYKYKAEGLHNGDTYYFVIKAVRGERESGVSNELLAVPQIATPGVPQVTSAVPGSEQVRLTWEAMDSATNYHIYVSTKSGEYGSELATVSGSVYTYDAVDLTNGTPYYFVLRASNPGGLSGTSQEVSATPQMSPPGTPAVNAPVAGNGQVSLSWVPMDRVTNYHLYVSTKSGEYGSELANLSGSVYTYNAVELTNGTKYYFTVKAENPGGISEASNEVSAVPYTEEPSNSGDNNQPSASSGQSPATSQTGELGTTVKGELNGKSLTTYTVDAQKLEQRLSAGGESSLILLSTSDKADAFIGKLTGQMVKSMEQKNAVLELRTDAATYTLPAKQIQVENLQKQFGENVEFQDIEIQIEIVKPNEDMFRLIKNTLSTSDLELKSTPVEFKVSASYKGRTIEIAQFSNYVERMLPIEDQADAGQITTAVVIDPDGTLRHVPTKIVNLDGKYWAQINSLTNSVYFLIAHRIAFGDVQDHWAKKEVTNLAARMVIQGQDDTHFNPDQDITRAEFTAIIVRALGLKPQNGSSQFADVTPTAWYHDAIQTAAAYHLIGGYEDGTFRPANTINREQAMMIMANAMKLTGMKENLPDAALLAKYQDADQVSEWAQRNLAICLQGGIIAGRTDSTLAPKGQLTRAEVAVMSQRLLLQAGLINP
ncbi:S-layer homology domain-containing protein [Paenibacillus sp. HWE-109]|uniref:S-layer homology domain-containing protein n=1 Tax=Paenibacillus sp. HWE-109 TaxID=1306526 RepID=UPI001EDFCA46|nr:S-layer homology domain-containing protein [Paenibacillus sp. HWE-109]UKS25361.1 S-layer homology domain-containing protein [Paenibacillus sp. HWE-109]